jgi:uncharacterized protein (TIGR00725 family)
MFNKKKLQIGIIGSAGAFDQGDADEKMLTLARRLGELLAQAGAVVVTGGKDGIMEAAAAGAKAAGGLNVGVVRGPQRFTSNPYIDIEVISGMLAEGMDELTLALMCDALILVGGGAGSLQEVTLAYRNNKPIIALADSGGWAERLAGQYLDGRQRVRIASATSPEQAVSLALAALT